MLSAGSVIVASDGSVSGDGLARALFDAHMLLFTPLGLTRELDITVKRGAATWANAMGQAIRDYLVANAVVQPGTFEAGGDSVTGSGTLT